jgi:hypothetical protein
MVAKKRSGAFKRFVMDPPRAIAFGEIANYTAPPWTPP